MKSIFPFLTIGLLFLTSVKAEKIEGRIIFESDTMEVVFNIPVTLIGQAPNYEKLQQGVKYYDASGKKKELRPSQANEIQFTYESRLIRMLSRQNMLMKGGLYHYSSTLFLKLEEDGPLKLFRFYSRQNTPGTVNTSNGAPVGGRTYTEVQHVLQKGEDELIRVKSLSFKKDMAEYFADCPALAQKIEAREYRYSDITGIVRFYNVNCKYTR